MSRYIYNKLIIGCDSRNISRFYCLQLGQMIIKQISNNPAINGDRFAVCNLTVSPDEVVIYGHIEYRDTNGDIIPDTVKKPFSFDTTGNMVDMTGSPAVMIHVPIIDGE